MLQGRLFSYGDAQRYRLGVNAEQIPVNKPRCPFHAYHRDGAMRVDGNYGATKGYEPNSYGEWKDSPHMKEPPLKASGNGEIYNYNEREYDDDYYSQPGDLFRLMPADEQQLLFENTARAMGDSELFIKQRHTRNCYKAAVSYTHLDVYKRQQKRYFATDRTDIHTLEEAIKGADVFLGLSKGNVLSQDMVRSMAPMPIVFALANPTPEISYEDAMSARPDVLMATGRSDYPNQINNVIGFPYIFRGALDTQAKAINEEMKIAAVHACLLYTSRCV